MSLPPQAVTFGHDMNSHIFDLFDDEDSQESESKKVQEWLRELGLGRYATLLHDEGFDHFSIIRDLDEDNIDELIKACKMPRLHERQFRKALEQVRGEQPPTSTCDESTSQARAVYTLEHSETPFPDGPEAVQVSLHSTTGADEAGGIGTPPVDENGASGPATFIIPDLKAAAAEADADYDDQLWECLHCRWENGLKRKNCQQCGIQQASKSSKRDTKKSPPLIKDRYGKQAEKNKRKKNNKKTKNEEEWTCLHNDINATKDEKNEDE